MDNYNSISTPPRYKFDTIQVFRFIAALTVIIFHATEFTADRLTPGSPLYEQGGSNGVGLFFAISGFVMIISSENLIKKTGGWRIFAIKRIIRIVPIYWIISIYKTLTLIFASSMTLHHGRMDASYIIKSFFFIPVPNSYGFFFPIYSVGWTLNFEMFFYLLFAVALAIRFNPLIFLSIIFIPLAILSPYVTPSWPDARFYFNPIVLNFLYGMIAAKLILRNIKLPQVLATLAIILGLVYLFLPKSGMLETYFSNNTIMLQIAAFLVVFGGASIEGSIGSKLPKWVVYLGAASYSLYLIHPSVGPFAPIALKMVKMPIAWLSILLATGVSIVAGVIFYRFCEKPLSQYLSKLAISWKLI